MLEALQQIVRVILDRANLVGAEHLREHALHHTAIFQHVAHAAGRAAVVLQDQVLPFLVANQIGPADVDVNVSRNVQVEHLPAEHLGAVDQLRRNHPLAQNTLLMINVLAEKV